MEQLILDRSAAPKMGAWRRIGIMARGILPQAQGAAAAAGRMKERLEEKHVGVQRLNSAEINCNRIPSLRKGTEQ